MRPPPPKSLIASVAITDHPLSTTSKSEIGWSVMAGAGVVGGGGIRSS